MSQRRWCLHCLGVNFYWAIAKEILMEETWFLCACSLPSPRRCPICCEILDPLKTARLEGGRYINEYELAFPETAYDMGYLNHLSFHPHLIKPTKAEQTLSQGRSSLGLCVFWFRHTDPRWRHSHHPSPSGIWHVRLSSPHLGRRWNVNLSVSLSGNIRSI